MPLLRYGLIGFTFLSAFSPIPSLAALTTLPVPDQGWGVTFDAPPLRPVREADSNAHYMYSGNAGNFAVSLYVDTPMCSGGETHEDVVNCFWPKASQDPLINQASVAKSCTKQYCKISYDFENTFQDAAIRQKHVLFLFATHGRWANLHVSVSNPTANDLKLLEKFEASLGYQ